MIAIKDNIKRKIKDLKIKHYQGLCSDIEKKVTLNISDSSVSDFIKRNLRKILIGKPSDLLDLHQKFEKLAHIQSLIQADFNNPKDKSYNKFVSKSIDYDWFARKNKTGYNAYKLTNGLGIKVCPYCNANYTLTITKGQTKTIRPALDHYFAKNTFPLLALSFYNLIPSCNICNSSMKGAKISTLTDNFHPYIHDIIDDVKFEINTPKNVGAMYGLDENFDIKLKVNSKSVLIKQAEGHIKAFKLDEIYNEHKDIVSEILYKSQMSNGRYMESLKKAFPKLNLSQDDFYRVAYGNYLNNDDLSKRPMSKLAKDIIDKYDSYLKISNIP